MEKDPLVIFRMHDAGKTRSYVDKYQNAQHKDLLEFSTSYSLKKILREFLKWGLTMCFFDVVTGDNQAFPSW